LIPKTVLKTTLKTKEITYTLVFGKYLDVSFRSHSIRPFSVFGTYIEDYLRNLTCRKKCKNILGLSRQNRVGFGIIVS
jgi:hypothetical protein